MTRIPTYRPGANTASQRDRQGVQRLLSIPDMDAVAAHVAAPPSVAAVPAADLAAQVDPPINTRSSPRPPDNPAVAAMNAMRAVDKNLAKSATGLPTLAETSDAATHRLDVPATEPVAEVVEPVRMDEPGTRKTLSFRHLAAQATSSWRRKAMVVSIAIGVGYVLISSRAPRDMSPASEEVVHVTIPDDPVDRLAEGPLRVGPAPAIPGARAAASTKPEADPIFAVPRLQPHTTPPVNRSADELRPTELTELVTDRDVRGEFNARPQMIPPVTRESEEPTVDQSEQLARRTTSSRFGGFEDEKSTERHEEQRRADQRGVRDGSADRYPTTPASSYRDPNYQLPTDSAGSQGRWQR